MEKKFYLKQLSLSTISLIDLNYIINGIVSIRAAEDINKYYNSLFNITLPEHKQLFLHHFIQTVCETYTIEKSYFSYVFYYNTSENPFNVYIEEIIQKLDKHLPIIFYMDKIPFSHINDNQSGEMLELKEKINLHINNKNKKNYTFRGIKSYAEKNKLTFLSEEFFNDLKVKHNLYK